MKKKISEMTPAEYWKDIHSNRNLNGHIRLNRKDTEEALPHARHLAYCITGIPVRGKDILSSLEHIHAMSGSPERQTCLYQSLEYQLSQIVKDAAELIAHAGSLQEYLHGARASNETVVKLMKEREEGYKHD